MNKAKTATGSPPHLDFGYSAQSPGLTLDAPRTDLKSSACLHLAQRVPCKPNGTQQAAGFITPADAGDRIARAARLAISCTVSSKHDTSPVNLDSKTQQGS